MGLNVYVTVGTTRFDRLVETVYSADLALVSSYRDFEWILRLIFDFGISDP